MKKSTLTLVMISSLLFAKPVQAFPSAILDLMKKYPKTTAAVGGVGTFGGHQYFLNNLSAENIVLARDHAPFIGICLWSLIGCVGATIHTALTKKYS